jgi:hypothetical protein
MSKLANYVNIGQGSLLIFAFACTSETTTQGSDHEKGGTAGKTQVTAGATSKAGAASSSAGASTSGGVVGNVAGVAGQNPIEVGGAAGNATTAIGAGGVAGNDGTTTTTSSLAGGGTTALGNGGVAGGGATVLGNGGVADGGATVLGNGGVAGGGTTVLGNGGVAGGGATALGNAGSSPAGGSVSDSGGSSGVAGVAATGGAAPQGGVGMGGTMPSGGTGATAGVGPATLTVTSTTLADAAFNQPYDGQLTGSGGAGSTSYSWSVTAGALPVGITLATNGELVGTPLDDGTFNFTVKVTDTSGNWGEGLLALAVTRKRWVAYTVQEGTPAVNVPKLLDYTNASLPITDLSSTLGAGCGGTVGRFSPNGKRLLVTWYATCTSSSNPYDAQTSIYAVDTSSATAGTPKLVGTVTTAMNQYAWSPDSRWLVYDDGSHGGGGNTNKFVVDLSGDAPGTPIQFDSVGSEFRSFAWVNPNLFAWVGYDNKFRYLQRNSAGTDWLPAVVSTALDVRPAGIGGHTTDGLLWIYRMETAAGNMEVFDILSGTVSDYYSANAQVSPDLTYVVDHTNTNGALYKVASPKGSPIVADLGPSTAAVWANHRNTVVVRSTSTVSAQIYDMATAGYSTSGPIADTTSFTKNVFSPNDAWLGWNSTSAVAVSPITGTPLTPVSSALPSGGTLDTNIAFSPNSKWLLWSGQMTTAGVNEAYAVDLSSGTPAPPRKVSGTMLAGNNVSSNGLGFTSDSAYVYFQIGTGATTTLLLTSLVQSTPVGQILVVKPSNVTFQP